MQKLGGFNPRAWDQQIEQLSSIGALYFCIPRNDKLDSLWDTVDDRLRKIRHCQNIDGVQRPLALLDPPIDPELLIRARLAGIDIADVLADLYAPPQHYRYAVLAQKALEFCGELKSLGATLLAVIEKKDLEGLGLLRSTQEIAMLGLVESVKLDQVAEADANIQALGQTRLNVVARYRYLQRMLGATDISFDAQGVPVMDQHGTLQVRDESAPGEFRGLALVQSEVDQVSSMEDAHTATVIGGALKAAAAAGRGGAAVLSYYGLISLPAAVGANFIAQALFDLGDVAGLVATDADLSSRRSALIAAFQRRREEWIQQSAAAVDEIRQIDKQLAAANIRKAIAEKDLANHRRSIKDAREIDDYLREQKFSSAERYAWMETQLLAAHHGAYQVAFDLAKRAERAWRRELGETGSQWIKFGYWDGAKKGLLAGEQLHLDVNRMEVAYLERSKREYEITRHVSLFALDPAALITLRETGTCQISVPEALSDLDFPGHYFRRLKAVSVSIPCVVGPYAGVAATLKLLRSSIRTNTAALPGYGRVDPDSRFMDSPGGVEAVVTSSARNDSGLFETNLHDERFLPFEGAGAIATWELQLPDEFRAFDYDTISDVILHIRYTAREGGDDLKTAAVRNLTTALNAIERMGAQQGFARLFSLRRDFPAEWYHLTNPADVTVDSKTDLTIAKSRFPFLFSARTVTLTVDKVSVLAMPSAEAAAFEFPAFVRVFPPGTQDALEWDASPISVGSLKGRSADADVLVTSNEQTAIWRIEVPHADVATLKNNVHDLILICNYTIEK
jgi:hypothetical protein